MVSSHGGFLSHVIAILLELERKPVTAAHWINDLDHSWTFDLSKTFDLVPIVSDIERASMRYLWRAASLSAKAWRKSGSQCIGPHGFAQTVSEKEVSLREPLCFSWRLVEAYGLNSDDTKLFCRTMQSARVVTTRKSKQRSTVSTVAEGTPRATPTLLTLFPGLTGLCLKLEWASLHLSCVPSFFEA